MTERIRLIEKPVTVAISVVTSCSGLPLAMLVVARSRAAPPHPASCNRQKALFLSAKNGVGAKGSIVIDPLCAGSASRVAGGVPGREKGFSQLRTGEPPRSLPPAPPARQRHLGPGRR